VRLGPVALSFAGTVAFEELDNVNHRARVKAQGNDAKGRGGANATSEFRLEAAGSGSKVLVHTNLTLSGAVAQYGRGVGIIQATATQLMNQFAKCLKDKLGQQQVAAPPLAPDDAPMKASQQPASRAPQPAQAAGLAPAKPISGFALMAKVITSWFAGLFRRS
jgi:hypothetical protein